MNGHTSPLRVLVLCESLDLAGGVERFVCALANRLAREGMQVTVGSVGTPRDAVRYPLDSGVRLKVAQTAGVGESFARKGPQAWRLLCAQWRTGRSLARLMNTEPADVVVLNGLTTACSTLPFAWRLAGRTVCCDHNHFDARSRPWRLLRRWIYPHVAALVSLSVADAPRFAALNRRTVVIGNASALWADAPALPDAQRVLAVGRHVRQKGFDLLLQAWAVVARTRPAARLRIVGDGPLRGAAQHLARQLGVASSVEWCAATAQIRNEFLDAAVFVLPSRYEGMPLALLEAQALGVPSVAFDCPTGPAEILGEDTGLLVPPLDVDALATAVARLLDDRTLRERMAHAAIARSRRLFSVEAHEARWSALVREVAQVRS